MKFRHFRIHPRFPNFTNTVYEVYNYIMAVILNQKDSYFNLELNCKPTHREDSVSPSPYPSCTQTVSRISNNS